MSHRESDGSAHSTAHGSSLSSAHAPSNANTYGKPHGVPDLQPDSAPLSATDPVANDFPHPDTHECAHSDAHAIDTVPDISTDDAAALDSTFAAPDQDPYSTSHKDPHVGPDATPVPGLRERYNFSAQDPVILFVRERVAGDLLVHHTER